MTRLGWQNTPARQEVSVTPTSISVEFHNIELEKLLFTNQIRGKEHSQKSHKAWTWQIIHVDSEGAQLKVGSLARPSHVGSQASLSS